MTDSQSCMYETKLLFIIIHISHFSPCSFLLDGNTVAFNYQNFTSVLMAPLANANGKVEGFIYLFIELTFTMQLHTSSP